METRWPFTFPLGVEAQLEAKEIMASDKNILKPGSGDPTVAANPLDIILGCFWITKSVEGEGEGKIFEDPTAAITAQNYGAISLRSKIKVLPPNTPKLRNLKASSLRHQSAAFSSTIFFQRIIHS
jgi:DNA-directed RNA polymerase beta' subunit